MSGHVHACTHALRCVACEIVTHRRQQHIPIHAHPRPTPNDLLAGVRQLTTRQDYSRPLWRGFYIVPFFFLIRLSLDIPSPALARLPTLSQIFSWLISVCNVFHPFSRSLCSLNFYSCIARTCVPVDPFTYVTSSFLFKAVLINVAENITCLLIINMYFTRYIYLYIFLIS